MWMLQILQALTRELPTFQVTEEAINCRHNYVTTEQHFGEQVHLTRKGAIRAGKGVLDKIPGAYKDIDTVMENQSDLVEVVHRLKQVVTVKG